MREDMKHVIIDRPRTGGDGGKTITPKGSKRRWQRIPIEDHPRTESTAPGRRYGWDCKRLNEHLSPLRRWLRSNCGRRWDDVYSEICEHLSVRNAATAHVRDHAEQYVVRNARLIAGEICDAAGVPIHSGWRWNPFYVHPLDGTLREAPRRLRRPGPVKDEDYIEGKDALHQYRIIQGVWYEVELAPYPVGLEGCIRDVLLSGGPSTGGYPSRVDAGRFYGRPVYAKAKRQLNKDQIRKLSLWESSLAKKSR